ncbi:MAG TPA: type VI secretion system tip protein VgrG [Hanamia sp.]|nr:type VI secretion system tip protein VgrG [Hanamia sp.]
MPDLLIPNDSKHDVATFKIVVDGTELDPSYQLLSLSISKELNRVSSASIIFRDGDAALQTFSLSNKTDFVPGKKIEISIGRDSANTSAFKGIIIKHAIKVKANGNTQLQIECMDAAVKMTIGRRNQYFENVKDSDVFDDLISKYSLNSDAETTKLQHKELVQHNITDWDFMLLRAEANGMLVNVDDGTIRIAKPAIQNQVLQVNYGSSVLEFEAEMDARYQYKSVNAESWDYSNQQLFQADTSSSTFAEQGNITASDLAEALSPDKFDMHHSGHKLEQELQDWTDGIMLRSRLAKIRGRARFTGFSGIKPADTVLLSGVGDRFNGKAFVTAVRQDIGNGTWETQIQFGLDPKRYAFIHSDMNDAPSAGLVGGISGLQIGVVVQLESDPDGQDRIQVRIPVIDSNAQGIWTRIASLDAGNDRGAFFMPEIGDEVIVGFINDDPRDAVVLGMLHSSNKPAPITPSDANNEKGFTTRSKMHLSFNDDTKTIVIDTPAGNSITIDEKSMKIEILDQNQNKITMGTSGISLESPMNIDIKAGAVLTLSGGASLSIGAPSLSVKADADVSIQGAISKLSSSGITEISGSIVKIN